MEDLLSKYRSGKQLVSEAGPVTASNLTKNGNSDTCKSDRSIDQPTIRKSRQRRTHEALEKTKANGETDISTLNPGCEIPDDESGHTSRTYKLKLSLKIALWATLWFVFIENGFGAVFFVLSLLVIIYKNTGTVKDKNGLSAYSVFNPNFEQLEGTLTAEQFERELKFGAGSVKPP
ncbi:hypothetical protein ScPMuIL_013683 [Solemya velum]